MRVVHIYGQRWFRPPSRPSIEVLGCEANVKQRSMSPPAWSLARKWPGQPQQWLAASTEASLAESTMKSRYQGKKNLAHNSTTPQLDIHPTEFLPHKGLSRALALSCVFFSALAKFMRLLVCCHWQVQSTAADGVPTYPAKLQQLHPWICSHSLCVWPPESSEILSSHAAFSH